MTAPATSRRRKTGRGTGLWQPSSGQRRLRAEIARAFGFEPLDAVTHSRARGVVRMRCAQAWVLCKRYPQLTLEAVGQLLARDHSTVSYALGQAEELRATDMEFHFVTTALLEGRTLLASAPERRAVRDADRRAQPPTAEDADAERDERAGEEHFGGIALGSFMLIEALRRDHRNLIEERIAA